MKIYSDDSPVGVLRKTAYETGVYMGVQIFFLLLFFFRPKILKIIKLSCFPNKYSIYMLIKNSMYRILHMQVFVLSLMRSEILSVISSQYFK